MNVTVLLSLVIVLLVIGLLVTVHLAFMSLRAQHRAADSKEQMYLGQIGTLIDRAMYASGHVWTPPPVATPQAPREYAGSSVDRTKVGGFLVYPDAETLVDPDFVPTPGGDELT